MVIKLFEGPIKKSAGNTIPTCVGGDMIENKIKGKTSSYCYFALLRL
jgi:hypothetical protein